MKREAISLLFGKLCSAVGARKTSQASPWWLTVLVMMLIPAFSGCFDQNDNLLTEVRGTVTDATTGAPVEGIPVTVLACADGIHPAGQQCDSLTSANTDSNGSYIISFRTKAGYHYKAGVDVNARYFGASIVHEGVTLQEGKTNSVSFQPIPFKVLQLIVTLNKEGRNYLSIDYRSSDMGEWIGGTMLTDTLSGRQQVDTVVYAKLFPQRTYVLNWSRCYRTGTSAQSFQYSNCFSQGTLSFTAGLADTTKVEVK
ncbi:MAG: carboxypeptidase-like regulatory domain-containing protein [Cyclobacteriaceae bacterium]